MNDENILTSFLNLSICKVNGEMLMTFISIFFSGVFKFLLNILTFKWQLT